MPLKAPERAAEGETGELIKWSEEWRTQAAVEAVVILHVRERLEDGVGDRGGKYARFVVDALFATGPRKGQIHHDVWVVGNGMTGPLKREKIGAEPVYRLHLDKSGAVPYAQANDPGDQDMAAAEAVYREGWYVQSATPAADASDAPF